MRHRVVLLLLLLLFCLPVMGQGHNVPFNPQAAAGGTDFTADSDCLAAWIIYNDDTVATALLDRCTGDASDNLGAWVQSPTVATAPAGTASGWDATDHDGVNDWASLADAGAKFAVDTFTAGCWVSPDDAATFEAFFSKEDSVSWELAANSDFFRGESSNNGEQTATSYVAGATWYHFVERVDEPTVDQVELFVNGIKDCTGACISSQTMLGTDAIAIGADYNGASDFDGQIMECFYFDRYLSDTEIKEITLCGMKGDADGATRATNFGDAACTGAGAPFTCCTGSGTGTCVDCDDISTCC